jgi:hypothetical protein
MLYDAVAEDDLFSAMQFLAQGADIDWANASDKGMTCLHKVRHLHNIAKLHVLFLFQKKLQYCRLLNLAVWCVLCGWYKAMLWQIIKTQRDGMKNYSPTPCYNAFALNLDNYHLFQNTIGCCSNQQKCSSRDMAVEKRYSTNRIWWQLMYFW